MLLSLIIINCFFLILSKNPVYSVLFLIIIFFLSSSILILFNIDFISILFLIIYVGAIAVLFLFVVMMLNVKSATLQWNEFFLSFFIFFSNVIFVVVLYYSKFCSLFDNKYYFIHSFQNIWDSFFNINIFGQYFYNFFIPCFLIAGFILLLAMLGAIVLTLKFVHKKRNNFNKQLSRTNTFISFFN
jgi:NADH-quinone oxidoreductase subunit J